MLHAAVFLFLRFVDSKSSQDYHNCDNTKLKIPEGVQLLPGISFGFILSCVLNSGSVDHGAVKVIVSLYSPKQTAGILTTDVTPSTFALARTS